jgi:Co/Zn/Cd efflux system component
MISDAIDILDARVINLKFVFDVLIDPALNRSIVLQSILSKLQNTFNIKNFNIDQPIVIDDIVNQIYSTNGIISVNNVKFENISSSTENRVYSSNQFDVSSNTRKGILFPPAGGIFEIKYPQYDIIGRAAV